MTTVFFRLCMVGVFAMITTGCGAVLAPNYIPAPGNVHTLEDAKLEQVKLGNFTSGNQEVETFTIRGTPFTSPYESSFVKYLKEALRLELEWARLLSPTSNFEISAVLLRNELNAAGINTADAQIEARFTVKSGGQLRFDKIKSARIDWESSFQGAIAIPKAQQSYPTVVQQLLISLYSDPDFMASIKK